MYIKIDQSGLARLQFLRQQTVKNQLRWYYAGATDALQMIVVVCGQMPIIGQIWDANSGHEQGYRGFCRPAHVGKTVGKITFRQAIDEDNLPEDAQILTLNFQIDWIINDLRKRRFI